MHLEDKGMTYILDREASKEVSVGVMGGQRGEHFDKAKSEGVRLGTKNTRNAVWAQNLIFKPAQIWEVYLSRTCIVSCKTFSEQNHSP